MNESAAAAGITAKSQLGNYYRWVKPDSDITVSLKLEMVERLQLEVLRGIDSSSHAGNEVGGILLGRTEIENDRTLTFVDDFELVPCEHRNGPSYTLTVNDWVNFEAALARKGARQTPSVVGYYRSHNRDRLFLSADDLQIIRRHFRRPDSLFLLIKPLPNRACTVGFFFWRNGHIQSEFTDSEAPLIPVSLSSAARSLSLRDPVHDMPAAPQASLLPVPEEAPAVEAAISPGRKAIASLQPGRSRDHRHPLIRSMLISGVSAAVTFAVLSYREQGPAREQTPSAPQPVPVAAAESALPAPTPVRALEAIEEQPAPVIARPPKTAFQQSQNKLATPLRGEPKLPTLAPPPKKPAVHSPVVRHKSSTEAGTPPFSKPWTVTAPLTGIPEGPLNTAPPPPSPEPTIALPVPVAPPPMSEKPVTPTIEATRTDATVHVAAPVSTTAPAPPSPAAHTFVGAQVIHQVTPAVPRGFGPMITTDVQVDVAVAIDAKGKVTGARVALTKGTAAGLLTMEALKAAQLFRFQPAQENGRTVASSMVLTFRFARTAK